MSVFRRRSSAKSIEDVSDLPPPASTPTTAPAMSWNDPPVSWTTSADRNPYDVNKRYTTANNTYTHRRKTSLITNLIAKGNDPYQTTYSDWRDAVSPGVKSPRRARRWLLPLLLFMLLLSGWMVWSRELVALWPVSAAVSQCVGTVNGWLKPQSKYLQFDRHFAVVRGMYRTDDGWRNSKQQDDVHDRESMRWADATIADEPVGVPSQLSRVEEMWAKHMRVLEEKTQKEVQ